METLPSIGAQAPGGREPRSRSEGDQQFEVGLLSTSFCRIWQSADAIVDYHVSATDHIAASAYIPVNNDGRSRSRFGILSFASTEWLTFA